jgi:thiol:disulfide interchange protein DsbA
MSRRFFLSAVLATVSALALAPALAANAPAKAAVSTPIVEGVDYVVIEDGKPFAPVKGKVEVVEVFGYTCPHCAHFEPTVSAWKAKRTKDVNFVPLAAPFGGYWMPYAKAFYSAQELGAAGRTHAAVFKALHEDHALPINGATVDELATFYAAFRRRPGEVHAGLRRPESAGPHGPGPGVHYAQRRRWDADDGGQRQVPRDRCALLRRRAAHRRCPDRERKERRQALGVIDALLFSAALAILCHPSEP